MLIRPLFAAIALCLTVSGSAVAEENTAKEAAKEVGHATGTAAREVGHGAKKATKEVGKAVKEAARETGHAFRDGAKEFKKAVTSEDAPAKTEPPVKKDK